MHPPTVGALRSTALALPDEGEQFLFPKWRGTAVPANFKQISRAAIQKLRNPGKLIHRNRTGAGIHGGEVRAVEAEAPCDFGGRKAPFSGNRGDSGSEGHGIKLSLNDNFVKPWLLDFLALLLEEEPAFGFDAPHEGVGGELEGDLAAVPDFGRTRAPLAFHRIRARKHLFGKR